MRTIRFDAEAIDRYLWRMQSAKSGMDAALSTLGRLRLRLLAQAEQAGPGSRFYQMIERLSRRIREAEGIYDEIDRLIRALRETRELFEEAERKAQELASDPALSGRPYQLDARVVPGAAIRFEFPPRPDSLVVARTLVLPGRDLVYTALLKSPQGAPQLPEFLREAP